MRYETSRFMLPALPSYDAVTLGRESATAAPRPRVQTLEARSTMHHAYTKALAQRSAKQENALVSQAAAYLLAER